jgi:RNA polymerase sigma-70 factor (ECF subfamily)
LTRSFLSQLGPERAREAQTLGSLEAKLSALLERCRVRVPPGVVDDEVFLGELAKRLPAGRPLEEAIDAIHCEDLYLALACVCGNAEAIAAFEAQVEKELNADLARIDPAAAFTDEVRQLLRQKLFVCAEGEQPRITEYLGHAPLSRWVRVIAVRMAIKLQKRQQKAVRAEGDAAIARDAEQDPELLMIRSRYNEDFQAAFQRGFERLTARERNLLRMHLIDELSIDEIGAFYRTHRSTAARWLQSARTSLSGHVREALRDRLNLPPSELHSLMRLMRSQLGLSVHRMLVPGGDEQESK